jgi:hypothetical protein
MNHGFWVFDNLSSKSGFVSGYGFWCLEIPQWSSEMLDPRGDGHFQGTGAQDPSYF